MQVVSGIASFEVYSGKSAADPPDLTGDLPEFFQESGNFLANSGKSCRDLGNSLAVSITTTPNLPAATGDLPDSLGDLSLLPARAVFWYNDFMRLNIGFSNVPDDELPETADKIVTALTGNAHFPSPTPTLAAVTAATDALRAALALPAGAPRATAIAATRATLESLLQALGQNLAATPGVTPAMLATSGYTLPKKPTRTTQPPPAPGNVRLANGTASGGVLVRCNPSAGASSYQTQWTYDPVNGPWNDGGSSTSTRNMSITGLTRAKDVWVRVRALGPAGYSAWSDPATILVT